METPKFEVVLEDLGVVADATIGNSAFKILVEPKDMRRLRASIMEIARFAAGPQKRRGILILDEPEISLSRLKKEWESNQLIFKSDVLNRMALVIHRDDVLVQMNGQLNLDEQKTVEVIIENARKHIVRIVARGPHDAFSEILRILLIHWFRNSGPLTSKELCEQSGFSYPTVAIALEKLEAYLIRHSDRSIELRRFPRDAWFKLISQMERVRDSEAYSARKPRPPEVILTRLRELGRDDIAVAGVLGARHYLPGLDIIGNPRLDLVVHCNRGEVSNDFLRQLDPALKPMTKGESPQVVIHKLYRPTSFFQTSNQGEIWADEIECLLDLHAMHLESQALEFIDNLTPKSKA